MKLLPYAFLFVFILFSAFSRATVNTGQTEAIFDSAFYHIYFHTSSEDLARAAREADSLYHTATTDVHRIRALMLVGDVYHRLANRDSVIHYAERAAQIAIRTKSFDWQARIYGVLSTQYREMGLFNQGRRYLALGLRASEQMATPQAVRQFKGQVYQEMGFYDLAENKSRQAVDHFKQASVLFEGMSPSPTRAFCLLQSYERLGLCYANLRMLDSAMHHYLHALTLNDSVAYTDNPVTGFIYNGIGRVHMEEGNKEEAIGFFNKALAIAEKTTFPNLQLGVYQNLASYYRAVGDMGAYVAFNEKYLSLNRTHQTNTRGYTDQLMAKNQAQLERVAAARGNIILLVCVLLGLVVLAVIVYTQKQRKQYRRFQLLVRRSEEEVTPSAPTVAPLSEKQEDPEPEIMPEATKLELLKKLAQFEAGQDFTDRNLSIAMLAGNMKTNTKYLSHVINKYKQKDFNTYVNALRVDYVINKMNTDPQYLKYKISYMAEDGGFSSHSKFTTVFKTVTGLSPSTFIAYLQKQQQLKREAGERRDVERKAV